MNPNGRDPESASDVEEPIRLLRDQEHETASDFLAKVRNRIHRRSSTAHIAGYSWHVPRIVLVEMATMLSHIFTTLSGNRRSQR